MIEGIPLPVTNDPVDAPFWQAAREGRLVMQCCGECGQRCFPPRPTCPGCQSDNRTWQTMSGAGKVWSFVAPQPPLLPAFEKLTPYVTALVELDEDPSLRVIGPLLLKPVGDISGVTVADVTIGDTVQAVFKPYAEDVSLVCWALQ